MAIDFGRMLRGVSTGYLSAKIANTEANDRLKEDIIRQSGENFYNNTLPEFQKRERNREETYNKVSTVHGNDVAEYLDQQGLITGNSNDYAAIDDLLSRGNGINKTQLKAYLEGVEGGSYASRKEKRFQSIADQEKFVMGNMTKNGFGVNTLMSQLGRETTEEQPMAPTETQAVAPVPPEDREEEAVDRLPSFEEIFGTTTEDKTFKNLDITEKNSLRNRALAEFNALFKDELTGDISVTPSVKDQYDRLPESQKRSVTLNEFAFNDFLKNRFLPQNNITFEKTLPADIVEAKSLINQYRAIGDEYTVKIIKQRLINAGYDIRDYNL
jgi:uncharacterized protein (UPF0335 family)